jgi:putative membrane protein
MADSQKILVLSIDRDNDVGEKAKINGPFIGEEKCLEAANKLILADPEDSDSNAIFAAVKQHKEIPGSEVALITGDTDVGVKSDEELTKQLKEVIKKVEPTHVVVVTDGAEDEHLLPIIQSYLPILSIKRVIIRQSQNLESSYYMIKDFIQEIVRDPKLSRVFLGLPAIALLILAIFGATGWRLVIGAVGTYLLIRGLQLEILVTKIISEYLISLKRDRISFFFYTISIIIGAVSAAYGYYRILDYGFENWLLATFAFINGSVLVFFIAGFFIWTGKIIGVLLGKQNETRAKESVWHHVTILSLFFALTIAAYTASEFLLNPSIGPSNLIFAIGLGFAAIIISLIVEKSQIVSIIAEKTKRKK